MEQTAYTKALRAHCDKIGRARTAYAKAGAALDQLVDEAPARVAAAEKVIRRDTATLAQLEAWNARADAEFERANGEARSGIWYDSAADLWVRFQPSPEAEAAAHVARVERRAARTALHNFGGPVDEAPKVAAKPTRKHCTGSGEHVCEAEREARDALRAANPDAAAWYNREAGA